MSMLVTAAEAREDLLGDGHGDGVVKLFFVDHLRTLLIWGSSGRADRA
jgi:hypothetical protein